MKKLVVSLFLLSSPALANWAERFGEVGGVRYAILWRVDRTDCDSWPRLKECSVPGFRRARASVVVYERAPNEPVGERSGVAGSTRKEIARFYDDCDENFCREDSKTFEWIAKARREKK